MKRRLLSYMRIFLLFVGLSALSACVYYQRYPMPKSRLTKVDKENLMFYAIDASHPLTRVWHVSELQFKDGKIHGFLSKMAPSEALEVSTIRSRRDARDSRDQVLVYVSPRLAMGMGDTLSADIPYEQIERVEVHEPNFGKSVGVSMLGVVGIFFVLAAAASGY